VNSHFDFYKQQLEKTEYFSCQIVLNDYTLVLLENDLQTLLSIDKDDVYYFIGCFKFFEIINGEVVHDNSFRSINSNSMINKSGCYDLAWFSFDSNEIKFPADAIFGTRILFVLYDTVDIDIINTMIPQLYESYKKEKNMPGERERFKKNWKDFLQGWKERHVILSELSGSDKALYADVADMLCDIDHCIHDSADLSGEGQFCKIVLSTMQRVRNGDCEDDIVNFLTKYCRTYRNEDYFHIDAVNYRAHRMKKVKKLINYIKFIDKVCL